MSDHELIRCIKRHFGTGIAREVRPTTVKKYRGIRRFARRNRDRGRENSKARSSKEGNGREIEVERERENCRRVKEAVDYKKRQRERE